MRLQVNLETACDKFLNWLVQRVVHAARGDRLTAMEQAPYGKFWLGRLAPEAVVISKGWGDRGERLDPCAVGLRFLAVGLAPWKISVSVAFCAWRRIERVWQKT